MYVSSFSQVTRHFWSIPPVWDCKTHWICWGVDCAKVWETSTGQCRKPQGKLEHVGFPSGICWRLHPQELGDGICWDPCIGFCDGKYGILMDFVRKSRRWRTRKPWWNVVELGQLLGVSGFLNWQTARFQWVEMTKKTWGFPCVFWHIPMWGFVMFLVILDHFGIAEQIDGGMIRVYKATDPLVPLTVGQWSRIFPASPTGWGAIPNPLLVFFSWRNLNEPRRETNYVLHNGHFVVLCSCTSIWTAILEVIAPWKDIKTGHCTQTANGGVHSKTNMSLLWHRSLEFWPVKLDA